MVQFFHDDIKTVLQKRWAQGTLIILLVIAFIMGADRAGSAHFGSDFNMYYSSGEHFTKGEPLYANPDSGAPYVYPPFAAFLFQSFDFFAQGTAIGIAFVLNFFLTLINAALVYSIARKLSWSKKQASWALVGALVISFTDVWNNINFSQINPFIFFLTLSGIYLYISDKKYWALTFWSLGAWIKVLPVIFIFWGLIRNPRWKNLLAVGGISILCIGLPIAQRGWELGLQDLFNYYQNFLQVNMGGVNIIWRNQSLSAALTRIFIPESQLEFLNVPWSNHVVKTSVLWIKLCSMGILLVALGLTAWKQIKKAPITITELAMIYLATHLFSGITWRGHLLTTLFIFIPLFRFDTMNRVIRTMRVYLIILLAVVFLTPKGLVGADVLKQIHLWSIPTWSLLALFSFFIADEIRKQMVADD